MRLRWRDLHLDQPSDVLLPVTALFFAVRLTGDLAASHFGAPAVTMVDVASLVVFAFLMALIASVAFPARGALVWATAITVERAARTVSSVWFGGGWQMWAVSIAAGGAAILIVSWLVGPRAQRDTRAAKSAASLDRSSGADIPGGQA